MHGLLADQGVGNLVWSPLSGGIVARPWGDKSSTRAASTPGRDQFGRPMLLDSDKAIVDAVERIAADRGMSMATVAMAWVLNNPVVDSPIIGATKAKHLTDAAAALELTLTDDEVAALEAPYTPREPTFSKPQHEQHQGSSHVGSTPDAAPFENPPAGGKGDIIVRHNSAGE